MVTKIVRNFNFSQICRSGQCFRMNEREDGRYAVIAGNRYLEVWQDKEQCYFDCEDTEFEIFWKHYFDLEEDYENYIKQISTEDVYLKTAADFGSGIRILRQDLWEMIVSFLISQQNNIPRIRRCIQNICEAYGKQQKNRQGIYYSFPEPEVLAMLGEDDLKACNLGYRSKYVVRTAKSIAGHELDLEEISKMPYLTAREELLKLYGVGEKVADCICLYALHKFEAFPVDTHIRQALEQHYGQGFPTDKYEGFQGVMQQYIFYYELYGKQILQKELVK
ncbi:MAG: DNA glycosylase [Lachnospiraceae bacterium]|nr:DNA glycosylase [Lachnospiraceae bacterium]